MMTRKAHFDNFDVWKYYAIKFTNVSFCEPPPHGVTPEVPPCKLMQEFINFLVQEWEKFVLNFRLFVLLTVLRLLMHFHIL